MLIDTHCHLYFDCFDADRDAVLQRMAAADVRAAVLIGIDPQTCAQAAQLVQQHPQLHFSVGMHPTSEFSGPHFSTGADGALGFDAESYLAPWFDDAQAHGGRPAIAVGECGIDLHWDANSLQAMQSVFTGQLRFARQRDLPVIIHTRDADEETAAALEQVEGVRGILHCFNGSERLLQYALKRPGWFVSFAGNLSYPKAQNLRDAAVRAPLDRLLCETDAPFMPPQPVRKLKPGQSTLGQGRARCEPAHVAHTYALLAELRGVPLPVLAAQLAENAARCFGITFPA
jgi:TatD DNase family protein